MADPDMDEDLFADLYDGEDADPVPQAAKAEPAPVNPEPYIPEVKAEPPPVQEVEVKTGDVTANGSSADVMQGFQAGNAGNGGFKQENGGYGNSGDGHGDYNERPIGIKEDGKMFIGGLNWETTDQSLKDYFSQFGEVVECTVMRDGATGRSRGFGFLTFKDPKNVNTVMVKEHQLDGKLIDPKRAIPRDEQERTAKIFVGGVSQDATEADFKEFFMSFGRVLDATLMMDKDTGRPRGFGFVTFDSDAAVDRTLEGPLAILNKPIEVKRAQPRGNMREEDMGGRNRFGRHGRQDNFHGGQQNNFGGVGGGGGNQQEQMVQDGQNGGGNNMSPAMMAAYWQRMQQYFQMMQQRMASNMGAQAGGMNPMAAAMQQNPAMMQQMMAQQGMNPAMMQQMAAMQGGGFGGMQQQPSGSPHPGAFSAQEQMMFEQQKYERQAMGGGGVGRMPSQEYAGNQNTWEGMYDDVPAPAGMQGAAGGGGGGGVGNFQRGGGFGAGANRGRGGRTPQPSQAPANAPTGPKNAGRPGANYRGGGRGGHRGGFHPYARGGG